MAIGISSYEAMERIRLSPGARHLARIVADRNLSHGDVRDILGCKGGVVSKWLSGKRSPGRHFAVLIEEKLGVIASEWDADEEEEPAVTPDRAA